jgi:methionine-rich copper-binding protein CopC
MRALFILSLLPALLLAAPAALAHAFLSRSSPAVGSTVHQPPSELRLWFTEELEGAFSTAEVTDAGDRSVVAGPVQVDPGNHQLMIVPLKPLTSGRYHVKWHALSVDTHTTTGTFTFEVAP